jgi:hypothetical protein
VTLTRLWLPSPNYSSRGGTAVRLAVIHTAEGATTIQALGSFFANPASKVSSHTGIDDTPNTIADYVQRPNNAWTQANANPYSVATELCAFASWDRATWLAHPVMLSNCISWLQEECAAFGIPWVRLTAAQAQDGRSKGICGHVDLGTAGGNHWDPGPSFPWDIIMAGTLPAPDTQEGAMAIRTTPSGQGYWIVGSDGGVFTYGDAQFYGSLGDTDLDAPITDLEPTPTGCGYWLLGADGGVFTFGDAAFLGAPTGLVK